MKKTLFKYTSVDFVRSCIENGVYASHLDQVNDPYEGNGIYNPNQFRIVCLTSSPKAMLMWAYYGNHHGCCIEYDVSEIPENVLRSVEYIDYFQDHQTMTTSDDLVESLYKKGKEWQNEKEVRAVYCESRADQSLWNTIDKEVYLKAKVVSVTFGLMADEGSSAAQYFKVLQYLRLTHPEIEVRKVTLSKKGYSFIYSEDFNLTREIQRMKNKDFRKTKSMIERETDNRRKLEKWIDTSWATTTEDRKDLAINPYKKFTVNNLIIRDSNVKMPTYKKGLSKVEPYDLDDFELQVFLDVVTVEVGKIQFEAEKIGCIRYCDIDEILDKDIKNYPFPTIFTKWNNGPYFRIRYRACGTLKMYDMDEVVEASDSSDLKVNNDDQFVNEVDIPGEEFSVLLNGGTEGE